MRVSSLTNYNDDVDRKYQTTCADLGMSPVMCADDWGSQCSKYGAKALAASPWSCQMNGQVASTCGWNENLVTMYYNGGCSYFSSFNGGLDVFAVCM